MKILVVLAVFLGVSLAAPAIDICSASNLNATMIKCLTDNGLSLPDLGFYNETSLPTSMSNYFSNYSLKYCGDKMEAYMKASDCMSKASMVCSPLMANLMPTPEENRQMFEMVCNDKAIKFECVDMFKQKDQMDKMQACISQASSVATDSSTSLCESIKQAFVCEVGIIRQCDFHTADVVNKLAQPTVQRACSSQDLLG